VTRSSKRSIGGAAALWLLASVPACEGLEDIPDDRVICCQNGDQLFMIRRIDCVFDPAGRVVEYERCGDAGASQDE
jgi:hypothetical protein